MPASFTFVPESARRIPDPNFTDVKRHIVFTRAKDVPKNLPFDPNARVPNTSRRVYRDVEKSLLGEDVEAGTFHLKHKGITLVARRVLFHRKDSPSTISVVLDEGHGIVDGGHTYELLTKDRREAIPDDQFVKFEILTGVPEGWIVDIARGLNTSVQVQPMSIDHLAGRFDWIKDEIESEPYFGKIAWRENEKGELDARDLVAILTCFNIELFPNDGVDHPVEAYERKSKALQHFEEKGETFERLRPILKEILLLHDKIRLDSRDFWNENGGRFASLAFVENKKRGIYDFPFIGKTGGSRLMNGALYPMLASFRWMVEEDSQGDIGWRGGFGRVLDRWESSARELLRVTADASRELGRNPNAIGKSRNHWANLHTRIAMRDLMDRSVGLS